MTDPQGGSAQRQNVHLDTVRDAEIAMERAIEAIGGDLRQFREVAHEVPQYWEGKAAVAATELMHACDEKVSAYTNLLNRIQEEVSRTRTSLVAQEADRHSAVDKIAAKAANFSARLSG